ncbi:hypothetical protein L7F22_018395 [Adiantum nelumboides]|nr:hypothetical protein [Adiantum nelumboides]
MGEPSSSWQNFNFRDDEGSAQGMQALRLLLAKLQEAQANPRLKPSANNLLMTEDLMLTSTQRLPSSVAPMHLEGGEGVPVMHGPMQANVVPHPLQGPLQTDGAKKKQYHGQERHVGKIREEGDFHDDDDEPPSRSRHKKRTNERRTKRSRRNSSGGSSSSSQSGRSSHGRFPKKDQNVKLRADEGQVLEDVTMYRQIVGSLIYLTISWPHLSYTVGLESYAVPRKPHLDVVRRTLRYASATLDYALFYDANTELQLSGFKDADGAGSACDRRSTNGFMFSLGSAAITWSSKKQPTVALSSTEAEYKGAAVAACEVAWLELLVGDLGIQVQRPVVIHCDNLNSIQLARNSVFHARTKHIEVHYHFIRERVLDGSIDLTFVRIDEQVADIFTKALGAEKLRRFRAMLGVRELALSLRGSVEISSSTHGPPG